MSDSKKEIHVKDLIIRADNVHFESPERESHPWFGPRMDEEPRHEEMEEMVSEDVEMKEDDQDDGEERRPPFFWI
ncbi:hypothetical protein [Alkalibacillus haloalkaliphilus]|uniref:Uncharacterized protein n=1 Tax=Alkalibacillus haloalkaliphilus TaxID=94136 RepID=A0A511W3G3_9BACI|nr:hypothetical protein [Alkalibacillus haloalkaliphilus]MDV2582722.1 hypothetical protein [Alkalibacillus haloalkaliphilus]GEN45625.1 hypothetical protein AHA02nite_14010 [Alkalibacillus haloalkaliphilus]